MSGLRLLRGLIALWHPGNGAAQGDAQGLIAAAWSDIVGPDIARRTRPARVQHGVLTVLTTSSAWSHQLTFLEPAILASLQQRYHGLGVVRLRFCVATGGSKALLEGASLSRFRKAAEVTDAHELPQDPRRAELPDDPALLVERMRRSQARLDVARAEAGWRRCSECRSWFSSAAAVSRCAPCESETLRRSDARIERLLMQAPWLHADELAACSDVADGAAYERVKRRLLNLWEQHLYVARRRLRREALECGDRIIAWSYVMLVTGMPQHQIRKAVISDVLDAAWADALHKNAPDAASEEAANTFSEKTKLRNGRMSERMR